MSAGRQGRSRGLQQRARELSSREGISYQEALRRLRAGDEPQASRERPSGLPLLTTGPSGEGFEVPPTLVAAARVVRLGGEDGDAINPWDIAEAADPPADKVRFLVALHEVLLGRSLALAETMLLSDGIRGTYQRRARRGTPLRERRGMAASGPRAGP